MDRYEDNHLSFWSTSGNTSVGVRSAVEVDDWDPFLVSWGQTTPRLWLQLLTSCWRCSSYQAEWVLNIPPQILDILYQVSLSPLPLSVRRVINMNRDTVDSYMFLNLLRSNYLVFTYQTILAPLQFHTFRLASQETDSMIKNRKSSLRLIVWYSLLNRMPAGITPVAWVLHMRPTSLGCDELLRSDMIL